jgi:serine/threonine-protein kinase
VGYLLRPVKSDGSVSEPVTFLATAATEMIPQISPDGRFLAYVSNESGRNEIFVRPFPEGARKWQASLSGGKGPHWSRDGTELYYVQDDTSLIAVAVSTEDGLTLGRPQKLFESTDLVFGPLVAQYDVSADGRRFVTIAPVEGPETAPARIRIVENWYAEFRGREQD